MSELLVDLPLLFAQDANSTWLPYIYLLPIPFLFYFMIIRPQSKKAKELQKLLSDLKKGDDVVTQGGIIGKVSGIKDNELVLQLQEGVRVRVLRSAVTGLYTGATAPAAKSDTKSEAKAS